MSPRFLFHLTLILVACSDRSPNQDSELRGRSTILISVDTLRADHLGIYGYERETTPNLQRHFAEGTVFENGMSGSPCTDPSVAQFLTGTFRPKGSTPRLAGILHSQGHATAAFTNQGLFDGNLKGVTFGKGITRGFDTFQNKWGRSRQATNLSDSAIQWLRQNQNRSFFLWVHYLSPHDPYDPPEKYRIFDDYPTEYEDGDRDRSLKNLEDDPPVTIESPETAHLTLERNWKTQGQIFKDDEVANFVALYDGEILYTDYEIGRLLDEVERLGLNERTLVILLADHGEWLGENYIWDHCMTLHQREIQVPFLVRAGGGHLQLSTGSKQPVSTLDIVPTVLDWHGIDYEADSLDGISLLEEQSNRTVTAFWEGQTVVMQEDWKLYYKEKPIALFNISNDPYERNDLLETRLESAEKMIREAERQHGFSGRMELESDRIIKRLKAIGYLN